VRERLRAWAWRHALRVAPVRWMVLGQGEERMLRAIADAAARGEGER
jgi:hypothetical protein